MRRLVVSMLIAVVEGLAFANGGSSPVVQTWVDGRFYLTEGQHFVPSSSLKGDLVISFYDDKLPWGTKVEVAYGLGGTEKDTLGRVRPISWVDKRTITAVAVGPYLWSAGIDPIFKELHVRNYKKLQFILLVTLPSGEKLTLSGTPDPKGHLEASLPDPDTIGSHRKDEADWIRLPLSTVVKDLP